MTEAVASAEVTNESYLGPAEVLSVSPLRARREDGETVEVELALTFPYGPQPGDHLLVIGEGTRSFAIGVLGGQAHGGLEFRGDVDLRAVGGTLNLRGDEGLEIDSPKVSLRAETLRLFAGALTERVDTAYRWAKELLTVRAGESRRIVQGEDFSHAEKSVILAEGIVKVDGDQVHLGH